MRYSGRFIRAFSNNRRWAYANIILNADEFKKGKEEEEKAIQEIDFLTEIKEKEKVSIAWKRWPPL